MHRDQSPLRARSAPRHVPSLLLDVDQMLDEFTRQAVQVEFRFYPDMPAVITVEFLTERGPSLIWRIGRELLHGGLTAMSGSGDVRMWPTLPGERPSSWLLLESQEVEALFEVPTAELRVARRHLSDHLGRDGDGRSGLGRLPAGTDGRPGGAGRLNAAGCGRRMTCPPSRHPSKW
ncbi:SsgA family sporulation/cell division regulator [Streptomyces nogalater]